MVDTEAAIDSAYEACWDRSCPLRLASDSAPSDIRARIDAVIADLDANSASVIVDGQIHVVRSKTLRSAVLNPAYFPMDPFDLIVNRIEAIPEGDFTDAVTKMVPEDFTASDAARLVPVTEVGAIIRCLDLQKP
ncbi:hypothetical protein F5X68DRAFT_275999 [Plectosphaerella plurivora]|uniref:Uncharacterized protein n=1 Tax=Plectosphaerella plurivora TaxID=936078 RepID=A0A9P8VAK6_9PEZI|nr:hypothetical protein F5X68DRAFT_275999 [Plectosphaerella plurivora]